ncbi:hypothetical protein [Brachybacterium huguangmaarense]
MDARAGTEAGGTGDGGIRALRGAAAATLATLAALTGHLLGGAPLPGPVGILLPWALALPLCTLLAGRRANAVRTAVSVLASQVLFHLLFVTGTVAPGATGLVDPPGRSLGHAHGGVLPTGTVQQTGPTAHLAHGAASGHLPSGSSSTDLLHDALGAPMAAFHLLAAAATILGLLHGERVLARALGLALRAVDAVRARRAPARPDLPVLPGLLPVPVDAVLRAVSDSAPLLPLVRRGPPAVPAR